MAKVTGFDELARTFGDAADAVEGVDGQLGAVSFDPNDPASIQNAIAQLEAMVDAKFRGQENNPIIAQMIEGMKEEYRIGILQQAAEARSKGSE